MAESTFQPEVLKVRLRQINSSQNSIQTMSMWIAHHHSSIGKIAEIWASEICSNTRGNSNWVLAMFYLANDIIQNSRKTKTSPVVKEFFPALKTAVGYVGRNKQKFEGKPYSSIERVVKILGERGIYNSKQIDELNSSLIGNNNSSQQEKKDENSKLLKQYETEIEDRMEMRNKAFGDAIELIKALTNPPSANSQIRQRIAQYPETIADPTKITPKSMEDAQILMNKISEAHTIVDSYAKQVQNEKTQTNELKRQLTQLNSFLTIESKLDKELLHKAHSCMDLLRKKRDKLAQQREMFPTEPMYASNDPLPDSLLDDL